ncbi:MAG TPA: GGDEF domain-containing protein, partial [Rhodopila sp.]|uniref:GGDEF domain-containing protein n=1 Tax=Rhodopila sp. TaxID=2480087 RepID=UPI002CB0CF59
VAMLLRHTISAGFGQIGIDSLTGIPNRRWFVDEADRRIDRLDRDGMVGTLSLVDVDDLKRLNDRIGRAAADRVLVRLASQLRAMVRPSDLVARIGEDEFAVWQDGMDHMTAAERAETLCVSPIFANLTQGLPVSLSIGIASRPPVSGEDIRTLLRRAHMAAREVKAQGGGTWRVSQSQPVRPGPNRSG